MLLLVAGAVPGREPGARAADARARRLAPQAGPGTIRKTMDPTAVRCLLERWREDPGGTLSNDLGAVGGLLFDIGSGRYSPPPRGDDAEARLAWETDLARARQESAKGRAARDAARAGDRDAMARFGTGLKAIEAIAREL
jgi:hypothetical protein